MFFRDEDTLIEKLLNCNIDAKGEIKVILNYSETDINRELAYQAYYATSQNPDKRADEVIAMYMAEMASVVEEFSAFVTSENKTMLAASLERYRRGYIAKLNSYLQAHSRVMSPHVTGPSNFPTRQNQKRGDTADKRRDEWLAYIKRTKDRLRKTYDPRLIAKAPISADDDDAIERLQMKIAKAEDFQALMKKANAIIRKKKLTDDEKVSALADLDIAESSARKLLLPDFTGKPGFPSYKLTNNNANIRRMKKRVEQLEKERSREPVPDYMIGDVTVSENTDLNRLQLFFPGKPPDEMRKKLKANGFRWAPTQGAWQRQLNDNARYAVCRVFAS
jgi:hypothetical protein